MAEDQNGNLEKRKLAILIDGDNTQPGLVKETLAEASKYGRITIRRIYGDWTTPNMNGWKESLQDHAIQPIQQFERQCKQGFFASYVHGFLLSAFSFPSAAAISSQDGARSIRILSKRREKS